MGDVNSKKNIYLFAIHIFLTYLSVFSPMIGMAWGSSVLLIGLYQIIKHRNENNQAAIFAAYFMSLEVVLRINKGSLSYEMGKYGVIILLLAGLIFQKKFHYIPRQYILFILLLLPAITLVEMGDITLERKAILFNLSGPFSLAISAIYFYNRKIDKETLYKIFLYILLPAFSLGILLFFKTPDLSEVKFGTDSNSELSGGFGPNQVSTILGLGIFIGAFAFISGFTLTGFKIADLAIISFLSLRGLLTFSRGGIVAAILGIAVALFFILKLRPNRKLITQIIVGVFTIGIVGLGVWTYTNQVTGGVLAMRYQGKSINDPNKVNFTSGRMDIIEKELEAFGDYPILGTGVGMGRLYRVAKGEQSLAAHTEYTRLVGEHGVYGVLALLILLFSPVAHFFNLNNESKHFFAAFMIVSLFTMFHGAMRLAMPGFMYGLSLICLTFETQLGSKVELPDYPEYNPPQKLEENLQQV